MAIPKHYILTALHWHVLRHRTLRDGNTATSAMAATTPTTITIGSATTSVDGLHLNCRRITHRESCSRVVCRAASTVVVDSHLPVVTMCGLPFAELPCATVDGVHIAATLPRLLEERQVDTKGQGSLVGPNSRSASMMRQAIEERTFVSRVLIAPRAVASCRTWGRLRMMGLIQNESSGASSVGYTAHVYGDLEAI